MTPRHRRRLAPLAAALVALCAAGAARADGPGIHAGELELHPEFFVQGGFDNNVFYEDTTEDPEGSAMMRVGAGISAQNRTPNKVALEVGGDLSYRHFFEPGDQFEARSTLDRADLNATVGFLPRAPITVELHENGLFRDNPAFDDTELGFRKLDNSVGVDLRFRPGENPDSRPFELRLGYRWQHVAFLGDDTSDLGADLAEKDAHHLRFLTSWRFLPKTSVLAEVGWTALDYDKDFPVPLVGANGLPSTVAADRDARPVYATLGLKGLVTRRVSTLLRAGYKNTFNTAGESFSSVIGTAELTYAIEPTLRTTLGYNRDGRDNAESNYYTLDQVYAAADFYFFGRWSLGGKFGYDHYAYSGEVGGVDLPNGERTDPVVRGNVYGGFNPRDWMTVKLELQSQQNLSDYAPESQVPVPAGVPAPEPDPVAFSRQLVTLQVMVNY